MAINFSHLSKSPLIDPQIPQNNRSEWVNQVIVSPTSLLIRLVQSSAVLRLCSRRLLRTLQKKDNWLFRLMFLSFSGSVNNSFLLQLEPFSSFIYVFGYMSAVSTRGSNDLIWGCIVFQCHFSTIFG